nr:DUF6214 family protein [Streptomyces indicus]
MPPWFDVRVTFGEGAYIDVLAVAGETGISIEDMRARPPLPLGGFAALTDWLSGPLEEACRAVVADPAPRPPAAEPRPAADGGRRDHRRSRRTQPRGKDARLVAAEAYRAAQAESRDPVLAVMAATGRSRRRALRLIAGARDAGHLAPRHNRR